jgi:predicted PurR-regulated permease PerM
LKPGYDSRLMSTPASGSGLGERLLHPETIWDRIVRWGIFCAALAAIVAVLGSAFVYLIWPLRVIFPPVALALVVVYLLNPLVSLLNRRGLRRGFAVAVIYLAFVAVVGVGLSFLIPVISHQITAFIDKLPNYVEDATQAINRFAARRHSNFRIHLTTKQIQDYIVNNRGAIVGVLGGVKSFAFGLIHVLITVVIGTVLSVYILLDLPKIQASIRSMMPERRRDEIIGLAEKIGGALGGFFRGQLLVALFVGIASAIGLTLVKIPFAAVVGLIAGVFNLVPLIGPFIGAIPAVILGLLSGDPIRALWGALVLLGVQQIDNHIISPNVMGRTVKLHPITVMLALLAAGTLFGLFGMLLIIPGIAAVKAVAQHLWSKRAVRDAIAEAMPDGATPQIMTESVEVEEDVRTSSDGSTETKTTVTEKTTLAGAGKAGAKKGRASAVRRTSRDSRDAPKRKRSRSR